MSSSTFTRTVPQVYRDCLRLIEHIGGRSRKADQMRALVEKEFRAHAEEKDQKKIESMKRNAMTGLANYLTMESLGKLKLQPSSTKGGSGGSILSPQAHLASIPQAQQPVSDRVLALQQQIRAQKTEKLRKQEEERKGQ